MDPDESIYPIAFVVVDSENNESWEWFMRKLVGVLGDEYAVNDVVVRIILVIAKIERNFEYIATKYDSQRFIAKCRDKTCKWHMGAVPLNSCGWWRLTVANDVHICGSNKRADPDLRTKGVAGGIAELFKHKFKDLDGGFTPKQLVKDIKRKYGVVTNYRQGYSACKH
ncbi:hypothetical protein MKX01_028530, partial [Papaver californicum]